MFKTKSSFMEYENLNNPNRNKDDTTPDLIYYNATVINGNQTVVESYPHPICKFQEMRDQPICDDPSTRYMSVMRATVDGPNLDLPLFLCPIELNQTNINLSIYTITLTLNKKVASVETQYTYQSPMIWQPENITTQVPPTPTNPLLFQSYNSAYYYAYTYNHVVSLFNQAILTAYNAILEEAGSLTTQVPYIRYDPKTNLFSLYFDSSGYGITNAQFEESTDIEQWTFWGNSDFYTLFNAFASNLYPGDDSMDGENCQYLAYNDLGLNLYTYNYITYYVMTQDYPSVNNGMWSPVDAVVLTTTLIPSLSESTGQPLNAGGSNNASLTTQNAFQPIMTDIAVPQTAGAQDYKSQIYYAPQGNFRYTSMSNSTAPINNIDLQLFWRNRNDLNLYPMTMPAGSSMTVKLLFKKKNVNY